MATNTQQASWQEFFTLDWANSFVQWNGTDEQGYDRVYGGFVESIREIDREIIFRMAGQTYCRIGPVEWTKAKREVPLIRVPYQHHPYRLLVDGQLSGAYCLQQPRLTIIYPPGTVTEATLIKEVA